MSKKTKEDYYAHLDDIDQFANVPSWGDAQSDEIEPWWERFYDERNDYDQRDEVER